MMMKMMKQLVLPLLVLLAPGMRAEALESVPVALAPQAPAVDGLKVEKRSAGEITFTMRVKHGSMLVKFDKVLAVGDLPWLRMTVDAPVPGRLTFFYLDADGVMVSANVRMAILPGRHEYELDLREISCGKDFKAKAIPGFEKFGGRRGMISGLRVDFWFPAGTPVKFGPAVFSAPRPAPAEPVEK